MPVNCRTCRYYQRMIQTKYEGQQGLDDLGCWLCADFKHRKSFYEPIVHRKADREKGDEQINVPGT